MPDENSVDTRLEIKELWLSDLEVKELIANRAQEWFNTEETGTYILNVERNGEFGAKILVAIQAFPAPPTPNDDDEILF